jgi:hypothetical protein
MLRVKYLLQIALGVMALLAAAAMLKGRGVSGQAEAVAQARAAFAAVGFTPTGDPAAVYEGEQELAWALERARPGPRGVALAHGQGGAVRWRVNFPGGGEAEVTVGGDVWALRRPVPTAPGPDLFPSVARDRVAAALPLAVHDPGAWRLERVQSWREAGHIWQRARFAGGAGQLPGGWQRELELEMVGSTVVSWRLRVHPLSTDLGVVTGRVDELRVLRRPALLGLALLVIGVLLAGAEATAYREPMAIVRGIGYGALVAGCALAAGQTVIAAAGQAIVLVAVIALLPTWTELPAGGARWGPAAGVLLAATVIYGRGFILGTGAFIPMAPPITQTTSALRLAGESWLPALVEEPLLRGVLPAFTVPFIGWWGAALAAAPLGALLHPLPAVPLLASLALEAVLQLELALVARLCGVGGAVLARGTCETLVRRAAFPVGVLWDRVALAGAMLGIILLAWPRRSS